MLSIAEEAKPIVEKAIQRYNNFFKEEFPTFEYIKTTNGEVTKKMR